MSIRAAFRSLKNPDYKRYFTGQAISQTGSWMHSVALSWLVYRITGSPTILALVGFVELLPGFFLGPWIGVFCDRVSIKRLLINTQMGLALHALLFAALAYSGMFSLSIIFSLAAIAGLIHAFDTPARSAFVGALVANHDIANAIALNSSTYNTARVLGPAMAGVIIATFGEELCFALNFLSFLPMVYALIRIKNNAVTTEPHSSYMGEIKEALDFIKGNSRIKSSLFLVFVSCFFGYSHMVLMPVFAKEVFGGDATQLGMLMTSIGLGAVLGALVLASRESTQNLYQVALWSTLGFAATAFAFANTISLPMAYGLLALSGFFMVNQMGAATAVIQCQVNPRLRGRVMTIYTMGHTGIAPLGAVLAGQMAELKGAPFAVSGASLAYFSTVVLVYGLFKQDLRRIKNRGITKDELAHIEDQIPPVTAQAQTTGQTVAPTAVDSRLDSIHPIPKAS
jgi:MFS family permease